MSKLTIINDHQNAPSSEQKEKNNNKKLKLIINSISKANNDKASETSVVYSYDEVKQLKKQLALYKSKNDQLQEENQNILKAYNKLKSEFEELQYAKELAEIKLKNVNYTDCQAAGIISSLRIAKEKAEKLANEYKEAKEKAEKKAAFEKKEKVKAKLQLENIQASMKNSLNKAASALQQIEKAEAELNQHKKMKNMALLEVSSMRVAKSKAEKKAASLRQKVEEEMRAREEAEQRALEESDEKILVEAELIIQMKENENLLKQTQVYKENN